MNEGSTEREREKERERGKDEYAEQSLIDR